jgi:hypothetical protein
VNGQDLSEDFPSFPRFYNGLGHILVGETLYLVADESATGVLVNVRVTEKPTRKARTIVLKLEQAEGGQFDGQMRLTIWNNFWHSSTPSG